MKSLWTLLFVCWSVAASAQPSPAPLSAAQKSEIVEAAASAYADYYVFADKGQRIADHLRRQQRSGVYARLTDPAAFARALTGAIQAVNPDRHIEILPPEPATREADASSAPQSRAERLDWAYRLRRRNYDFVRVQRLPGNIGYLRLDSFPPPEVAAPTAAAAMAFLKHSDALIIDLRENGGGTGDMVRLLASYFFVEPTRLSRTFRRDATPQVSFDSTLTYIEGERMPVIDLFILTSPRTNSAAEAFAFALQQRGRAVIVGEISAGAGNAGEYLPLAHGFRAFVPDVHVSSPISDATWEGRGVHPDLAVPAATALTAAHREAARRLLATTTDEVTRAALGRALEAVVE